MGKPNLYWERCPVCHARLKESSNCPRCALDFLPILEVLDEAEELSRHANFELKMDRKRDAFWSAFRAVNMHLSQDTLKSLALAALAVGYFDLALALRRKIIEFSENTR